MGQDAFHAGQGLGGGNVDRADPGKSMRAAQQFNR